MDPIPKFSGRHFPFPLHSVLVWHRGKLLEEEYFSPYDPSLLHRMFSITKSFTALAVGGLIAEGKLALTDKIIRFFPEYVPDDPHPFLAEMTIEDMLSMRTCYKSTTYKNDLTSNWVQSFFTTLPDHRPGQIFKYDTSSAHTLAALVKKIFYDLSACLKNCIGNDTHHSDISRSAVDRAVRGMTIASAVRDRQALLDELMELPVVQINYFSRCLLMLHFVLTGEKLDPGRARFSGFRLFSICPVVYTS